MWIDPDELAAWYGPTDATVEVTMWDLHAGGGRQLSMGVLTPEGAITMQFIGVFVDVREPERLAYTEAMADQAHTETRVEVRLHDEGVRTTLELTHRGIPAGSPGEVGWAMALDKLATRVEPA